MAPPPPSSSSGSLPGSPGIATPSATGDESFVKSLFVGSPAEGLVFPYPEPSRAEVDEVNAILDGVRRFGSKHDASKVDREESISLEALAALRELGVFG